MSLIRLVQGGPTNALKERLVGANHRTLTDVVNRPLTDTLAAMGFEYAAAGDGSTLDAPSLNATFQAAAALVASSGRYCKVQFRRAADFYIGTDSTAGLTIPQQVSVDFAGSRLIYDGTGAHILANLYEARVENAILTRSSSVPLSSPVTSLVGTGIKVASSAWGRLENIEVDGCSVAFDIVDSTELDIYTPIAANYMIGIRFRTTSSSAYTTACKVFGGVLTTSAYSSMVGSTGLRYEKTAGSTLDGISVFGTTNEGPVERKLYIGAGCNNIAHTDLYWDQHYTGTDIEIAATADSNIIRGGAGLSVQVILDNGSNTLIEDPRNGDLGRSFRHALTVKPTTGDTVGTLHANGGSDAILSLQAENAGGATVIIRAGDNSTTQKGALIYPINESGARDDSWIVSTNQVERLQVQKAGDLALLVAGNGLRIKEGSNARMGTATLSGGTITVTNSSITASTRIFVSRTTTGGTAGHLSTTQTASTSFTINSSSGTDTSVVDWLLLEPS